jgi:hypothetical protein
MAIFVLDSTTKSLKANLTAAISSNPDFVVAYADSNGTTFTEGASDGTLNGTADVTLCSPPASGFRRIIRSISIYNKDTVSATINIKYDNNGTQRIAQRVPLSSTEVYTLDGVYDNTGSLRSTLNKGDPLLTSLTGVVWQANTSTNQLILNGLNFVSGPAIARFTSNALTFDSAVTVTNPYAITANVPANIASLAGGTVANVFLLDLYNRTTNSLTFSIATAPTGGTITQIGNSRIHSFTTSGTFTSTATLPIRYLVVAGGGGGGSDMGGGGGAGGYLAATSYSLPAGTYTVTVGSGGAGGPAGSGQIAGAQGTNSSISGPGVSIVAIGGGGGGSRHDSAGAPATTGGSGGGGSGQYGGAAGTAGQGYAGGSSNGTWYPAGGGGAGGRGYNGPAHGGEGKENDILGTNYYWAGGGGGSGYTGTGGNGGSGGGGGGAVSTTYGGSGLNSGSPGGGGSPNAQTNAPGGAAGANTGGGGGGGSHYNSNNSGGAGGSGIVVIRFTVGT